MPPLVELVDVDVAIRTIIAAYDAAQVALESELVGILAAVLEDPTSTRRFRGAQIRALEAKIRRLRAELDGHAVTFAEQTLAQVYANGQVRTAQAIAAAVGTIAGSPSFTGIHRTAVEMIALDSYNDLAAASDFMEDNARRVIRQATKAQVAKGAAAGTTVGQDAAAVAREIRAHGVSGFVDRAGRNWRLDAYAEMVVRTKSAQAYNTGTVLQAEITGTNAFEILDGERSRHDECLAYNRRTCTARWALDHPIQHPNAVTGATLVIPSGRIQTVYRLPWSGPVVRIRTARAGWTTVGPHHPMLTRRGWVPANELEEGDQLVRRAGEVFDVAGRRHLDDVPPSIEQVFDAAARAGIVRRVPRGKDHFHGDGRWLDGDVDAVDIDGPLPNVWHLPLVEQTAESALDLRRAPVDAAGLPGYGALPFGLDRVLHPAPGGVGLLDVRRIVVSPAERQSLLAKASTNDGVGDAQVEADLSRALACPVTLDEVVDVKLETMVGHLYDLSTEGGVYIADDRIVSNCVRAFGPLPLHRGPVELGGPELAQDLVVEEATRRRQAGELPPDVALVPPTYPSR